MKPLITIKTKKSTFNVIKMTQKKKPEALQRPKNAVFGTPN